MNPKLKNKVWRADARKAWRWYVKQARAQGHKGPVKIPVVLWNVTEQQAIYITPKSRLPRNAVCLVTRMKGDKHASFWFQVNVGIPRD